jgi:hypothetical protein
MNDLFFNGAKRLVKGAKNLDGVLICIKIGYITQPSKGDLNPIDYFCCEKINDSVSTR